MNSQYIYMIIDNEDVLYCEGEASGYENFDWFYVTTILEDFLNKIVHLPLHNDVNIIILRNHEFNDDEHQHNNIIFNNNYYWSTFPRMKEMLSNISKDINDTDTIFDHVKRECKEYIDEFINNTNFEELELERVRDIEKRSNEVRMRLMKNIAEEFGYELVKKE